MRLLESNPQALDEAQAAALRAEGIELVLGDQGPELFAGAKLVVPSPGLPVVRLREMMGPHADAEGTEILAEMELAWRALDGEPVLAVTGTSGKTTTVSLAAAMLREQGLRVFWAAISARPFRNICFPAKRPTCWYWRPRASSSSAAPPSIPGWPWC